MEAKQIMQGNPTERISKIIWDEPATTDAFDAGGHNRSAKVLANAIEQLNNKDGAIGLEGAWGAGKSTVIKLAEKILEGKNRNGIEYAIFPFDLWAHQSEDFRRAYLESFISWLRKRDFLSSDEAEKKRNIVRDKIKTVKQNKYRKYSAFGIAAILIAPLFPLAYSWLTSKSPDGKDNDINLFGIEISFQTITLAAVATIAIPYALFFLRLFSLNFRHVRFGKKRWFEHRVDFKKTDIIELLSRSISFFSKEIDEETTTQNIRDSDPTTIEFHRVFRNLLSEVQISGTRIILILDNIDRLPEENVSLLWSEVRALFSISEIDQDIDAAYVTAVVPYDKKFISSVFEKKGTSGKAEFSDNGADVFNKTFDRIIKVSPPILTNWKKFFFDKLDQAFSPILEEPEKIKVFKLLHLHLQEKNIQATPRRLISFINNVSPLWEQWGDDIPVATIALYVLNLPEIERDIEKIQRPDFIDQRYLRAAGIEEWQLHFASLAYNVAPKDAKEVLLRLPIAKAITQGSPDNFVKLSHSEGFEDILPDIISQNAKDWAGQDRTTLPNVIRNLQKISVHPTVSQRIWKEISSNIPSLYKLDLENTDNVLALYTVLKNQSDAEFKKCATSILNKISDSAREDETEGTIQEGEAWLRSILPMLPLITKRKHESEIKQKITTTPYEASADFILGVAHGCAERSALNFSDFQYTPDEDDIITALAGKISNNPTFFYETLPQISPLLKENNRQDYLEKISNTLRNPSNLNGEGVCSLLSAFIDISESSENETSWKPTLSRLIQDGTIVVQFARLTDDADINLIAPPIVWLLSKYGYLGSPPSPPNRPTLGDITGATQQYSTILTKTPIAGNIVSELAKLVAKHHAFSTWAKFALKDPTPNKLYQAVFRRTVEDNKFERLGVEHTVINYSGIKEILGETLSLKFLDRFTGWKESFGKNLSAEESILKIPFSFISDCQQTQKKKEFQPIIDLIDDLLKEMKDSDWDTALENEDDRLRLLIARCKIGDFDLSVHNYNPAIKKHALHVMGGNTTPAQYFSEWNHLLDAVKPAHQKSMAKELLQELPDITATPAGLSNFIKLYTKLAEKMIFKDSPDVALTAFFSPILHSQDEEVRDFIKMQEKTIRECLKNATEDNIEIFRETIESLEEDSNEENRLWGNQLHGILPSKKAPLEEKSAG